MAFDAHALVTKNLFMWRVDMDTFKGTGTGAGNNSKSTL